MAIAELLALRAWSMLAAALAGSDRAAEARGWLQPPLEASARLASGIDALG